ncbi:GH36-type glycosyl hydrolase domain-containing protein [Massilia sp. H6]|uniref:GH36-type glycosyl hydrolase domain-containing protein n=1 Tax=Massilia sp. H6 TaxID=2970464 RepID=UPI002169909E|nr:glucoamylase family protein [Massilia sp. H6]UVW29039.1 hypothetical protein NRS07_02535 [Massilia sp. H6]
MNLEKNPMAESASPLQAGTGSGGNDVPMNATQRAARLTRHARQLASRHRLAGGDGAPGLRILLATHASALDAAVQALDRARLDGRDLPDAASTIVEHASLIDAQFRLARGQLLGDEGVLPCLEQPAAARVQVLAQEVAAQNGGRIEHASLARFIAAYQDGQPKDTPLLLAELRLLPAALRLALLGRLRDIALRCERDCHARALAAGWATRMRDTAEHRSGDLILLVADMARAVQPMGSSFVAELTRQLQGRGGALAQALAWIDARLADDGSSIAQQVQDDADALAADAIDAGHCLASLRQFGAIDWRALLEETSPVEASLRADPAGCYARMDGPTRDLYRHSIETLARSSRRLESEVAEAALALADVHRAPAEGGLDPRQRHIGYYLCGPGAGALEARLQARPGADAWLRRRAGATSLALRIGATCLLTLLFAVAAVVCARQGGAGLALQAIVALLALTGASALATALVDLMATWLARPPATPRMDFSHGIPSQAQALVAVSARLTTGAQVDALCRDLEVRYLANRDPRLRLCLLADLHDADAEALPGDAALVERAVLAIEALNRKHAQRHSFETQDEDGQPVTLTQRVEPFLMLQRPRTWNSGEQAWIGRARRRGQLADLNACLAARGADCGRERFSRTAGNTTGLAEVRYVITLDAAIDLPRDAARQLVGAMAHPLNQPVLDAGGTRILEGHAMLRPVIGGALPGRQGTRYQRLWAGARGTWAAALAGHQCDTQGMFGWAAIYDVDAYERVLRERLPDDALLKPGAVDEGCLHAAHDCGVRLEEAFPDSYGEHAVRRHRTVRAAWQSAGWVRAVVGQAGTPREANPMTPAYRWQLVDALRDSLVAPALVLLLVLCWSTLAAPAFWIGAVLSVLFLPALAGSLVALADRPHDAPWRQHLDAWARGARVALVRAALAASFLPHAAWCQLDGIARAVWRRHVSRRRQLEWRLPALSRPGRVIANNWITMWISPTLSVAVALLLTFANPYSLFTAAPVLLVWFLSPVLAWWTSLPLRQRPPRLTAARHAFVQRLARRSWSFFEDHAGPHNNWLPPESVQEHPHPLVDARTTPGAMALGLLATLAARDFGYLPLGALLGRLDAALASMALLERWHGHYLAAYDNASLAPCEPACVATADSGWMALSMRTLAAGLDELADAPVAGPQALDGIRAALHVVDELAAGQSAPVRQLVAAIWAALDPKRCRATDTLPGLSECLRHAADAADALEAAVAEGHAQDLRDWARRLAAQCHAVRDDLLTLTPWIRATQEYVFDASLTRIPTLRELAAIEPAAGTHHDLARLVRDGRTQAAALLAQAAELAAQARSLGAMDFAALLDPHTGILSAGCHIREGRLDTDSCDLLASEASMASFVAVAQGQLPQQQWWSLGRPLRIAGAEQLLLSRSGALSDYLAPQLLMPSWRECLLEHAGHAAVRAQVEHGRQHDMPWGFSESACNAVDAALRFELHRFGVPAAALRRAAQTDLVAAPYAAMLALPLAPSLALANLERMAHQGLDGAYGFVDAVDHTPGRLPHGEQQHVVRTVVARHQGMGLLALLQSLHDAPMQRRFAADPELRAALPLLQEPLPSRGASPPAAYGGAARPAAPSGARVIDRAASAMPEVQLLSNGCYHVMLASDASGYSRWGDTQLTRWQPDPLGGGGGLGCVLRDSASGDTWSAAQAPASGEPERFQAVFAEARAVFEREERGLAIVCDVVVAPNDDVELRRLRIRNTLALPRTLELTSHVVLAPPHAAQGEPGQPVRIDDAAQAMLCSFGAGAPSVLHMMTVRAQASAPVFCSTCLDPADALPPLDDAPHAPALAIRRSITLAPGQEVTVDLVLGAAATPAAARALALRYLDAQAVAGAIDAAWIHGQAFLRHAGLGEAQAQLYNRLAGCLLDPVPGLRADAGVIERNVRGRAALHAYGVGAGRPLLVLVPGQNSALVSETLLAHAYWNARGLGADVLVLCDSRTMRDEVAGLALGAQDGIRVHLLEDIEQEDRILLRAAAHVLLLGEHGSLADQLRRAAPAMPAWPAPFTAPSTAPSAARANAGQWSAGTPAPFDEPLQYGDGVGAYSADGREYLIQGSQSVPAPLANLLANKLANAGFGATAAADGKGGTWYGRDDLRLTAHDGEAFYLRDDDSGAAWSPTPWPMPSGQPYLTRHGFGYTQYEHEAHGIRSTLRCFVAPGDALKYSVLRLRNNSSTPRRLSVTGYVQWLMDDAALAPGLQVVTSIDVASGALMARNAFGTGFGERVGFFHVEAAQVACTADRREFVGRHRSLARPAALERSSLSGAFGAALDPCAALQVVVELRPDAETELVFLLGVAGPDSLAASRVVQQHGGAKGAALALRQVHAFWDDLLGTVRVETPDAAFDLFANGWLPYGALAGTMGASPARQLQGAMAAVHGSPATLRAALLRAAREDIGGAHCLVEDFLWLPFALHRYASVTGDYGVLREPTGGDPSSGTRLAGDDLYQYCVHGLRGCLRFGARGLPLQGARMHEGGQRSANQSESVRLAFVLATVLQRFAEVADRRADFGFATTCRGAVLALKAQAEEHGWDGGAYGIAGADGDSAVATQAWAALAGADPARVQPALAGSATATPQDGRSAAWMALALGGDGAATRAWEVIRASNPVAPSATGAASCCYAGAPCIMIDGVVAGWTQILLTDALLGLGRTLDCLALAPLLPAGWDSLRMRYRSGRTDYLVTVRRATVGERLVLDGQPHQGNTIDLVDDGREHTIDVYVERQPAEAMASHHDNHSGTKT